MRQSLLALFLALAAAGSTRAADVTAVEEPNTGVTLDNGLLSIRLEPRSKRLTITPPRPSAASARFAVGDDDRVLVAVARGPLGVGKRIQLTRSNGIVISVALYPDLPFACFSAALGRPTAATDFKTVVTAELDVDLGKGPPDLKVLGCDGLTSGVAPRASYTFIAGADPMTRAGFVGGWLTSERASGVVASSPRDNALHLEARSEYGKLHLDEGKSIDGETFVLGLFGDTLLGLEAFGDVIAKANAIKLKPMPSGYCTWYAKEHGRAADEKSLAELADFCKKELTKFGFGVVQIDDGWQISNRDFTDIKPKGAYASGMKPTADHIRSLGMTAGIWLIPFGWDPKRPEFAEHQDWFVHRADGSLYEVKWAGTCLDMTHPGAREFLKGVVARISREWGYQYIKVDGLWTGMATKILYPSPVYREDDLGGAVFHDPAATNISAYRDGLRLVREAGGDEMFIAGCNIAQNLRTLGASMGVVDSMRIGADIGAKWDKILPDMRMGSRLYFLQGRVWHNDPDCLMVRSPLTLDQARAWGSWIAISGQLNVVSEWLPGLAADRLEIVKRSMPGSGKCGRPVDLFEQGDPRVWVVSAGAGADRRDVVGLFNWDDAKPLAVSVELSKLGLRGEGKESYVGFDYWEDRFVGPISGTLKEELRPASCRVISLRPVATHPQIVGTSRHITQGIIDVSDERWDAAGRTLSGTSQVVGGDPYQVRIATPAGEAKWRAAVVELSAEDQKAGVTAKLDDAGPNVRVTISAPANRAVRWGVKF